MLTRIPSVILLLHHPDGEHCTNRRCSKCRNDLDTREGQFLKSPDRRNATRWSSSKGPLLSSFDLNLLDDDDDDDTDSKISSSVVESSKHDARSEHGGKLSASTTTPVTSSLTTVSDATVPCRDSFHNIARSNSILKLKTQDESEQYTLLSKSVNSQLTTDTTSAGIQKKKGITFSPTVKLHLHCRILGDNPAVTAGPPVTIEWKAFETVEVPLKSDDAAAAPTPSPKSTKAPAFKSRPSVRKLSSLQRQTILYAAGFTRTEIRVAVQQVTAIQLARAAIVQAVERQEAAAAAAAAAAKPRKAGAVPARNPYRTQSYPPPKWLQFFIKKDATVRKPSVMVAKSRGSALASA